MQTPFRFLLFAFAAILCARQTPALTIKDVKFDSKAPTSSTVINAGQTKIVMATAEGATRAWAVFRQGAFSTRAGIDGVTNGTNWFSSVWVALNGDKTFAHFTPPLNEGIVSWYVYAEDDNGESAKSPTYTFTVKDETTLPKARKPDFADFRASGMTTQNRLSNKTSGDWRLNKVSMRTAGNYIVDLPGISIGSYSANTAPSWLHTATELQGVGTIWFKARYNGTNDATTAKLSVLVGAGATATLPTPQFTQTIEFPVEVAEIGEVSPWKQFRIDVNLEGNLRVRFRNDSNYGSGFDQSFEDENKIELADIVITPISPDVTVTKDPLDYAPGYPSINDPVSFRIHVTNKWESAPATNYSPKLVWRLDGGKWNETIMTNTAGWKVQSDGTYACTLDNLPAGKFEYFHRVDFTGMAGTWKHESALYADGGVASVSSGVANADDYTLWLRADGYVSESHCPAYGPDFTEAYANGAHPGYLDYVIPEPNDRSYLFDLYGYGTKSGEIFWPQGANGVKGRDNGGTLAGAIYPVTNAWARFADTPQALAYDYRAFQAEDGVRRFRSLYDKVSLVTAKDNLIDTNNPYSGSFLEPTYDMMQVGDYTWQAIVHVTNAIDVAFAVHTTDYYDPENPSAYLTNTNDTAFVWGQVGQNADDINPPMANDITRSDWVQGGESGEGEGDGEGEDASESKQALPVRTELDYNGFMMFRFCTTNGQYQIRRAAWQNFDDWQADDTHYAQTYGIFGTEIFDVVASNLTMDVFGSYTNVYVEPTRNVTPENEMLGIGGRSVFSSGLYLDNAWISDAKTFTSTNDFPIAQQRHHRFYRLSGAKSHPGGVWTGGDNSYRDGRDSFAFRVRSSSCDDRFALYRNMPDEPSGGNGYRVMAYVASLGEKGDATNSVSAIGFWQDELNYWEARVSEGRRRNSTGTRDYPMLRMEVFKVEDGVRTLVGNVRELAGDNSNGEIKVGDALVLWLRRAGNGVIAQAQYYRNVPNNSTNAGSAPINSSVAGQTAAVTSSVTNGLAGVNTREFSGQIVPYLLPSTGSTAINSGVNTQNSSASPEYKAFSTDPESSWDLGMRSEWGGTKPWEFAPGSGSSLPNAAIKLSKPAPKVFYRVLASRSGKSGDDAMDQWIPTPQSADGEVWNDRWDEHEGHAFDGIMSVQSYAWTTNNLPMHFWDDSFVRVEVVATNGNEKTTGDLAFDFVDSHEWCGQDLYDNNRTYPDEVKPTAAWHASHSAVIQEALGSKKWDLDLTRYGDIGEIFIDSPFLADGIGDITFNWEAPESESSYTNYPVILEIERRNEANDAGEVVGVVTTLVTRASEADKASSWTNFTGAVRVPCLTNNVSGRLRIQPRPWVENGTNRLGRVRIDNLRASDYPNAGDSSWEGYNLLVSTFTMSDETRRLKFDGNSANADERRSAVLNDDITKDTLVPPMAEHLPYVQTPSINTGVGEIGFWYRGHPDNGSKTASLSLQVATRSTPTDAEWRVLTTNDLERKSPTYSEQVAAIEALDSITTNEWKYFNAEFFQDEYPLLRIYSAQTNSHNRVMIDNVLVTEPVRTGIDVGYITFSPDIPLDSSSVGVKVGLVNPRMRPSNIEVELQYYVGTNKWGYANWRNDSSVVTLPLNRSATDQYVFETDNRHRIERLPVDSVVQYCAKVTFEGTGNPTPRYSAEQSRDVAKGFWFENPEWYEPVDLNREFGTEDKPMAHYWVFSTPTNTVFINEVVPAVRFDATKFPESVSNQFVEIIGPAGVDISGWKLEVHDSEKESGNFLPQIDQIMWTNVLNSGATPQPDTSSRRKLGWGFWVLGGANVTNRNQEIFTDEVLRQTALNAYPDNTLYIPGALVLKRSMGAYADRVCWASENESEVQDFKDAGYRYFGELKISPRYQDSWSQIVVTNAGVAGFGWASFADSTPGAYNEQQEASIWKAYDPDVEDPLDLEDPPEISNLRITYMYVSEPEDIDYGGFVMSIVVVHLDGTFSIDNGSSLRTGDFEWQFLHADNVEDLSDPDGPYVSADVFPGYDNPVAEAGRKTVDFSVDIVVPAESASHFFRIRAIPQPRYR